MGEEERDCKTNVEKRAKKKLFVNTFRSMNITLIFEIRFNKIFAKFIYLFYARKKFRK